MICKTCQGNIFDGRCKVCEPVKVGFCPMCNSGMGLSMSLIGNSYKFEDGSNVGSLSYYQCINGECQQKVGHSCYIFRDNKVYFYEGGSIWKQVK
jgi:hypothetical protein